MQAGVRYLTNIAIQKLKAPKGADCTCGKCYNGWYSKRMEYLIQSQAKWACSFLSYSKFALSSERGEKFTRGDLASIPEFMLPFEFPAAGYVKSFLNGYLYCIECIENYKQSPPFVQAIAIFADNGNDSRQYQYFLDKGGQVEWAVQYCLDQVINRYEEILQTYFEEIVALPQCNNDWKFEMVAKALFLQPFEPTNETGESEKVFKQKYKKVAKNMETYEYKDDPPEYKEPALKEVKCTHPAGTVKAKGRCFLCVMEIHMPEILGTYEDIEFKECKHPERLQNPQRMCERCFFKTRNYPSTWLFNRSMSQHDPVPSYSSASSRAPFGSSSSLSSSSSSGTSPSRPTNTTTTTTSSSSAKPSTTTTTTTSSPTVPSSSSSKVYSNTKLGRYLASQASSNSAALPIPLSPPNTLSKFLSTSKTLSSSSPVSSKPPSSSTSKSPSSKSDNPLPIKSLSPSNALSSASPLSAQSPSSSKPPSPSPSKSLSSSSSPAPSKSSSSLSKLSANSSSSSSPSSTSLSQSPSSKSSSPSPSLSLSKSPSSSRSKTPSSLSPRLHYNVYISIPPLPDISSFSSSYKKNTKRKAEEQRITRSQASSSSSISSPLSPSPSSPSSISSSSKKTNEKRKVEEKKNEKRKVEEPEPRVTRSQKKLKTKK